MTQVKAYAPGLYACTAEPDCDAELHGFLSVQRESGMDYLSDGLLRWPELAAPLAQQVGQMVVPGRAAAMTGEMDEPLGEPYFRSSEMPRGRWFATLPSPLALAHHAGLPARQAAEAVLSPQIGWLSQNGCAFVVLQETEMPDMDPGTLDGAISALHSPLPLVLRLPPGDAGDVIPVITELPVEAVGADMTSTKVEALPEQFPKTLLAGVVDSRTPRPEEPSEVAARHESLLDRLDDEADLHLAPTGDLRALFPEDAARKVRRLGDAARILRGG